MKGTERKWNSFDNGAGEPDVNLNQGNSKRNKSINKKP